jgi:hypothetical protein
MNVSRWIEKLASGHKFIGTDPLDLIKFICKEFWEELFKKKVRQSFQSFIVVCINHRFGFDLDVCFSGGQVTNKSPRCFCFDRFKV